MNAPLNALPSSPRRRSDHLLSVLGQDARLRFWLLQGLGWGGLCAVTYLSLTLWYSDRQWLHVVHTLVQALLGVAITTPLHSVYRRTRALTLPLQIAIVSAGVIIGALAWTVTRLLAFDWITGETDLWSDLGGWFFGSFMVFAAWTAIYFCVTFFEAMRRARARSTQAEAAFREAQLRALRYQLQPHFLFNALNSIAALVAVRRNDDASEAIERLGALLRHSLSADPGPRVALADELDTARLYLSVEQARFGDRLLCQFDVDEEAARAFVPSFILQPLFENVVRHVVEERAGQTRVNLSARREGGALAITLSDDGPGYARGAANRRPGIGLVNIRERLTSEFGERAQLSLSPGHPNGLTVHITLPFEAPPLVPKAPAMAAVPTADRATR